MKRLAKYIAFLFAFINLYSLVVFIWASLSAPELLNSESISDSKVKLSPEQVEILLAVEDPNFFSHIGVDISGGQGLTTITSSLARDIFLGNTHLGGIKGGMQKIYKAVFSCCKKIDVGRDIMALVLNQHMSKDKQLQIFASHAYFGKYRGRGVIGFPAAAKAYFDKPLDQLNNTEFVSLVAMLLSPNYYHPINGEALLKERVTRINKLLSGACKPRGWLDIEYQDCAEESEVQI